MKIKFTLKSTLMTLFVLGANILGYAQSNNGFIRGTVYRDNRPTGSVEVILKDENDDSIKMVRSEINGEYIFANLPVGLYSVQVKAVPITESKGFAGYESQPINVTIEGQVLNISLVSKVDDKKTVRVVGAKSKVGDAATNTTRKLSDAAKTGVRNISNLAALSGGVNSGPSGLSNRGSRTDANAYYIDGVRVNNASLTQAFGSQVDFMQAGIPAQYGDFTGLGVSITTRGGSISNRKVGSLEMRTSSVFNPYHNNLIEGFYATPILFKNLC